MNIPLVVGDWTFREFKHIEYEGCSGRNCNKTKALSSFNKVSSMYGYGSLYNRTEIGK